MGMNCGRSRCWKIGLMVLVGIAALGWRTSGQLSAGHGAAGAVQDTVRRIARTRMSRTLASLQAP